MKNELIIVDSLKQESDKIDKISNPSFSKIRYSVPSYDLSGWNDETPPTKTKDQKDLQDKHETKDYKDPKDLKVSHFKHQSEPQSSENLIYKNSTPSESKISQRRSSNVMKKSITPIIYKVHKIFFEHSNLPSASRPHHPIDIPSKLISKRKSIFLKKRVSVFKQQSKNLSVLEELLKPEAKNHVTSIVMPRLKSRSEQYRLPHKNPPKKRINLACLDFNFLDPLHISAKSFNPN